MSISAQRRVVRAVLVILAAAAAVAIAWWAAPHIHALSETILAEQRREESGLSTEGSGEAVTPDGRTLDEFTVTLSDGRTVDCVSEFGSHESGMSCDWANATPAP